MYKSLVRPILFKFDPESIHNFTLGLLSHNVFDLVLKPFFHFEDPKLRVKVGNLEFRNPIGLAAGMDKNCTSLPAWDIFGFGFAEVGTVTPIAQEGNPKPRMFRLQEQHSIINRLGFNNLGADAFIKNIINAKDEISRDFIVGINIGKNKTTPLEEAFQDYTFSFEKLYEHADYFTINVSSPNTEGLRELQQKKYLRNILGSIQKLNEELSKLYTRNLIDVFLKISPDLTPTELDDILECAIENKITGVIATNTTVSRNGLPEDIKYEEGGLSGGLLKDLSNNVISYIKKSAGEKLHVIGCGGIFNTDDVKEKLDLGASLVQLYTGFVYEGPFVVKKLKKELVKIEA
jgi:dihydroorotate dehydrogenase